uniref:Uncharacterized protein n=1 Tax=Ralstonia solanacearum TaxID=305 RepID=A0A0S4V4W0_RALSL|nr:protein of unknown function [Ralstonia solanacearum]
MPFQVCRGSPAVRDAAPTSSTQISGTTSRNATDICEIEASVHGKLRMHFERSLDTHLALLNLACAVIRGRFVDQFC